jgi:hypothetical protein
MPAFTSDSRALDDPQAVVRQKQQFERFIGILQRNVEVRRFVPVPVERADKQVDDVWHANLLWRPIREHQPLIGMPIDPAEDEPRADRRTFEPAAQRGDRTAPFFRPKRNRHGRAGAFAVGLGAPNHQRDPLGPEALVGDLKRDELAAARRCRER